MRIGKLKEKKKDELINYIKDLEFKYRERERRVKEFKQEIKALQEKLNELKGELDIYLFKDKI